MRLDIKSETQAADETSGYTAVVTEDAPAADYAEGEWVTNVETGAMEWHAADGSVVSQEQWAENTGGSISDAATNGEGK